MNDEILHYASPYYDPVKAHEYYIKHRELKGRASTAGLNDEGKAAASYVKEQLTTERKSKVEANKDDTTNQIDKLREQKKSNIEAHKAAMQSQIDRLKANLGAMTSAYKQKNRDRIAANISFFFAMAASLLTWAMKRIWVPNICFTRSETIILYLSAIHYASSITSARYASSSSMVHPYLPAILSSSTASSSSLNFNIFSQRL